MTTSLITRRRATLFATVAVACAAVAPAASAVTGPSTPTQASQSQDLRSPDARDAANGYAPASVEVSKATVDLRSPDARDAAVGYDPQPVSSPSPIVPDGGDGFDWVSAAIGAACVGGLILLVVGLTGRGGFGGGRRHALHT
jgi:hypothetical protein